MDFKLTSDISYAAVFLQGLFSFFSPCVLPLLPVYIGYLSGGAGERNAEGLLQYNRFKVLVNTVFFVVGISAAFFLLGMGMSAAGRFLTAYRNIIMKAGGVLMVLFGLYQLGLLGQWGFLAKERRLPFHPDALAASPVTALLLGFAFSFAWTPCVGPMLSSVLILAAAEPGKGMVMILFYTLGFIIPFILLGLFSETLLTVLKNHKGIMNYTLKAGGILMIALGVLLFTGRFQSSGLAAETDPAAGRAQTVQENKTGGEQESETGKSADDAIRETVPAVSFTLKDQYGKTHTLSGYKGKVIFLNFWATWCPPCRAEMPDIQKLYEKSPREGSEAVIILGVAAPGLGGEKDKAGIREFMEKNGYTYPVLMDKGGKLFERYGIRAIPTTYLIDRNGNILGRIQGALSGENMEMIVRQALQTEEK